MKDQNLSSGLVELQLDFDATLFGLVLKWIYTDEIEIPVESVDRIEQSNAWQLWMYGNFFCLPAFISIVEERLVTMLNPENVCFFWNHIHTLEASTMHQACKKYFCSNLQSITSTAGLLALDRNILLEVFYPKQEPDAVLLSPQLLLYRTQALARWFATHQPERLKRKLTEQCFTPSKRQCREACSEERAQ